MSEMAYRDVGTFAFEHSVLCACCEQPIAQHEIEYFTEAEYQAHASVTEAREYTNLLLQSLRDAAAGIKLDSAALAIAKALSRGVKLKRAVRDLGDSLRDNWEE